MTHGVKLRRYRVRDYEKVMDVWLRAWKFAFPRLNWHQRMQDFRWYWKTKLEKKHRITLAELDGNIVGFITVNLKNGYIDQLASVPEEWGRDIGNRLMEEAKRLSPTGVSLKVNAVNHRARRFYEKHGLIVSGHEKTEKGTLIYLMKWQP